MSNPDASRGDGNTVSSTRSSIYDLAMVVPIYNEQDCIADVLEEWHATLRNLNINFLILAINDGSRDQTEAALRCFESYPRIEVVNKPNSGHGPTILMGYHKAVEIASWIFQCDSDNELKAEDFASFWEKRANYDALFGVRRERVSPLSRKLISVCSRLTVAVLFGKGIEDVNVPYRLMKSDKLKQIIQHIPASTFAPNIVIAGAFARSHSRTGNLPVTHHARQTGEVSIKKWKLLRVALLSLAQTIRLRHIAKHLS